MKQQFFRLRDGAPAVQGGQSEAGAARQIIVETAKLLNKVLVKSGSEARVATLQELMTSAGPIETSPTLTNAGPALLVRVFENIPSMVSIAASPIRQMDESLARVSAEQARKGSH